MTDSIRRSADGIDEACASCCPRIAATMLPVAAASIFAATNQSGDGGDRQANATQRALRERRQPADSLRSGCRTRHAHRARHADAAGRCAIRMAACVGALVICGLQRRQPGCIRQPAFCLRTGHRRCDRCAADAWRSGQPALAATAHHHRYPFRACGDHL